MSTLIKRTAKYVTNLWAAVFFLFLLVNSAEAMVTAEDINDLAQGTKQVSNEFMQKSRPLRLEFEFNKQFLNHSNSEKLHKLAEMASNKLQEIRARQEQLKQQIEDYQGSDWDDKYGATGLWQKLSADLYATVLNKCEIDFYFALSSQQLQKNKISQGILSQIDSLGQIYDTAYLHFLKARTLALLAQSESIYKPLVKKEFDMLMVRSDKSEPTAFRTAVERIKLFGSANKI